jgi:hypothetical protein
VVLTMVDNINKNDERQHRCRSSVISTSLLEPPPPFVASMWLALVHMVTWRCVGVVVVGVGDGCGWQPLVRVM